MSVPSVKLLKVVDALIKMKNIQAAAEYLNLSSSSINYALKEMRRVTGQALFLRNGRGLEPDESALRLQQKYVAISQHIKGPENGNTSILDGHVVISTYSIIEFLISQKTYLENRDNRKADVTFVPMCLSPEARLQKLRTSEVDIDIGPKLPEGGSIMSELLFESPLKVFAGKNNSIIREQFTHENWLNCPHARWSYSNSVIEQSCDNASDLITLLDAGDVKYESGHLLSILMHCANGDCIIALPEVFEDALLKTFSLNSYELPCEVDYNFSCYIHYRRSLAMDKGISSIISMLQDDI